MTNMTKYLTYFILSVSVFLLLTSPLASAHGGSDPEDNNQGGMGDHMGDHMDNRKLNSMNVHHNGFEGFSDHMLIKGNISISNAITLTISVLPSDEMQEMMSDRHMGQGNSMDMMNYNNTISLSLTKLVEFEDLTSDGYTADDIIISEYVLNKTSLNDVFLNDSGNVNKFTITSKNDDVFFMSIELNAENEVPYSWKWSLVLKFPFVSNSSRLAMLHDINSNFKSMEMHQNDEMEDHMGNSNGKYQNSHMSDNHRQLPMFFSWDDTAQVDNIDQKIIATSTDEIFSLSINQGSEIYYDPKIGVDPSDIVNINEILQGFNMEDFVDSINTPTLFGIIIGFSLLSGLAIMLILRKNK